MQPEDPYRLVEMLGSCPAGSVWSAVEPRGEQITVAVLDADVAADERWREAFSSAAETLADPVAGVPAFRYANFTARVPWVACGAGPGEGAERVFLALGQDYRPAGPQGGLDPAAGPPQGAPDREAALDPAVAGPGPDDEVTQPVAGPGPTGATEPTGGAPNPWSGGPRRLSEQPTSPAPTPAEEPDPVPGTAVDDPQPTSGGGHLPVAPTPDVWPPALTHQPAYPPVPRFAPAEPPRGRGARRLLAGVAVGAVLLAGAAAVVWWPAGSDESPPSSGPTAAASRVVDTPAAGTPALATPAQPGLEPPVESPWRTDWPQFTPQDAVRTYTDLADVGLVLKVPWNWNCSPVPDDRDPQTRRLRCGGTFGEDQQEVGGEVVVRPCPQRCTPDRQATMRRAEEAWGQQWLQPGIATTYAEISTLQVDGERRHGLVMVAYWRSGQDGSIDRQLVLRMTGPADGASPLRMIANHLRASLLL